MARAGFTASKILWLKRHEPETFAAVRHILLPAGYMNWCLTGQKVGSNEGIGFKLKPGVALCATLSTPRDARTQMLQVGGGSTTTWPVRQGVAAIQGPVINHLWWCGAAAWLLNMVH